MLQGVAPLDHLGVIRAEGEDAAKFLHGQLTHDFALLDLAHARLCAFLSAKGRMQASFIGFKRSPTEVWLVCQRDLLAATLKRLSMFVLRAKVRLSDASAELRIAGLAGDAINSIAGSAQPMWLKADFGSASVVHLPPAAGQPRALWVAPAAEALPAGAPLDPALWAWGEVHSGMAKEPGVISNVVGAHVLAVLGDMITTDHISPAGSFKPSTPAGKYLTERQVAPKDFNSYGSRRGNHEVMMRGTFANIRIKNEMLDGVEGGYTKGPDGVQTSIYDASMAYQAANIPLVIFGGIEYGAGSSRDWAAKGTNLLGVKAVIAESFERIHRSNLIGMGVIPFEFTEGQNRKSLGLTGDEVVTIEGLEGEIKPLSLVPCTILRKDGTLTRIMIKSRIDTEVEIEYLKNGGVLHYVLRNLAKA